MKRRFHVDLNPVTEVRRLERIVVDLVWTSAQRIFPGQVLPCSGAQEVLGHLLLAAADPGDVLLLCEPCYPPYLAAAACAGLKVPRLRLYPRSAQPFAMPAPPVAPTSLFDRSIRFLNLTVLRS